MFVVDLNNLELMETREGLNVAFPIQSAAGTADTAIVWMDLDPGAVLPEHTDSAEELLYVVEGSVEAFVGEESGTLTEGQIAVVPALAPHGLRNVGEGRARVLGFFSASTNIGVFKEPLFADVQVFVVGAPVPIAVPLASPVAA
jgi:quercetin dioxygenase-like cupin family protein